MLGEGGVTFVLRFLAVMWIPVSVFCRHPLVLRFSLRRPCLSLSVLTAPVWGTRRGMKFLSLPTVRFTVRSGSYSPLEVSAFAQCLLRRSGLSVPGGRWLPAPASGAVPGLVCPTLPAWASPLPNSGLLATRGRPTAQFPNGVASPGDSVSLPSRVSPQAPLPPPCTAPSFRRPPTE